MLVSPYNDSGRQKLWRLTCRLVSSTPNTPEIAFFEPTKFPAQKLAIFPTGHHWDTDLRMFFQKCSKSVQEKWPKVRIAFLTLLNNTFLHRLLEPMKQFPQFLCVTPHCHATFIQIG